MKANYERSDKIAEVVMAAMPLAIATGFAVQNLGGLASGTQTGIFVSVAIAATYLAAVAIKVLTGTERLGV